MSIDGFLVEVEYSLDFSDHGNGPENALSPHQSVPLLDANSGTESGGNQEEELTESKNEPRSRHTHNYDDSSSVEVHWSN